MFAALMALVLSSCGRIITPPPSGPTPTIPAEGRRGTPLATSTPAPFTPAPTSTPTLTPTPVIHVVQKGDNLWTIAMEYGVTVEALQEANAILDPQTLQIGQELVIPRIEEAPAGTPTPTPTPLPVEIQGLSYYESPVGSLLFLGEVKNTTGERVERVEVGVSLYDESGKLLATSSAFTSLDVVPDGGRAPFAVLFDTPPVSFASYQAVVLSAVSAVSLESRYGDLVVEGEGESEGPFYVVSGEVRNTGEFDAQAIRVVVTAYDAGGQVVGMRTASPENDVLAAGEASPFQVKLLPTGGKVASCSIQVQGRVKR